MDFDETVIFPFIERHIPKYEQMILFLIAEHSEFRDNFERFESLYKELKKEKMMVIGRKSLINYGIKGFISFAWSGIICRERMKAFIRQFNVFDQDANDRWYDKGRGCSDKTVDLLSTSRV